MRMTSKTRFSKYYVVHVCEPVSFWQEKCDNLVVIVDSLNSGIRIVAQTSYQTLEVFSFCDQERVN